jgi:hypothetical protein
MDFSPPNPDARQLAVLGAQLAMPPQSVEAGEIWASSGGSSGTSPDSARIAARAGGPAAPTKNWEQAAKPVTEFAATSTAVAATHASAMRCDLAAASGGLIDPWFESADVSWPPALDPPQLKESADPTQHV